MIHDAVVHKITRRNPFLQDWPCYSRIDILNPVATAQYQHSVTIASKPGMMHDFRDLRFFQADGTEIPFWVESKTDGSTAFVWFKPYSASIKNVYCFYGNRDAVSQSNGEKTFEFFDDFLGSAVDATKWTTSSGTTIASSIATITNGNLRTTQTFPINIALRTKASMQNNGNCNIGQSDLTSNWILFQGNYPTTNSINVRSGTSATESNANIGSYTGYHVYEYQRNGSSAIYYWVDNTYKTSISTNVPSEPIILNFASPSGVTESLDWILVRKYTATEPVCQLNQSGLRNPAYR